jgi:hypothetical protein
LHLVSGNLELKNSSWIGWYNSGINGKDDDEPARAHKSSFDGIYLTNGNLTNGNGCVITLKFCERQFENNG